MRPYANARGTSLTEARFVILKDKLITRDQLNELEKNFADFLEDKADLDVQFYVEEYDFGGVPIEEDPDGDTKPAAHYRKALADAVYAKYGSWGTDSVVMLVHRDNWRFKGIWGINYSNIYHGYHFHVCRFDNRNIANSLGTLYHEWMHCLDALIKTEVGVDINKIVGLDWDRFLVHGGRPGKEGTTKWKYIKWKDNAEVLTEITPHLQDAYARRKEMYLEPVRNVQWRIISVLRSWLNRKNGQTRF